MSILIRIIILSLTFLLNACNLFPAYKTPSYLPPEKYIADNSVTAKLSSLDQWWILYQDQTLNDLMAQAEKNNLDLQAAIHRIAQAQAVLDRVAGKVLPQIDLKASGQRTQLSEKSNLFFPPGFSPVRSTFQAQISTVFELDFWKKLQYSKQASLADLLASQYAKDVVKITLQGNIASQYWALRSIDAQILFTKLQLQNRQSALEIIHYRQQYGASSLIQVQEAEQELLNLQANFSALKKQRGLLQNQIGLLLGNIEMTIAETLNLPEPPQPQTGLPATLLTRRPDIAKAEQDLMAQNARLLVNKTAFYPSINLTASAGYESRELKYLGNSGASIWNFGATLDLPIFDWGQRKAIVEQASAREKELLVEYQKTLQKAFTEVNDALIDFRESKNQTELLLQRQKLAEKTLALIEGRYHAGDVGKLEVLNSQYVVLNTDIAKAIAHQNHLLSSVALFKALGGGWERK